MSLYDSTYIILGIVILSLSLRDFFRKKIMDDFTEEEFYIFSNFVVIAMIILYSIYLLITNRCNTYSIYNKMNKRNITICIIASIFSFLASMLMLVLLKKNDLSFVIPQINPAVIILTVLLGVFLLNEELDKLKVIGIILVIFGLISINLSKTN